MIKDVQIKQLQPIKDDRGLIMEFLRDDDEIFENFGQVYVTLVKKGVAKAWHHHNLQDDHFICVEGKALVALCDMRKNSPTYKEIQDFRLAAPELEGNHLLIKIPRGVAHGFTALDCEHAKIINIPTAHYNHEKPDEQRYPWNSKEIGYEWPSYVKSGG